MNIERHSHKSVAIKNKFFVVGNVSSQTIEVFDSCSGNFALLQHPNIFFDVTSIGNKVVIFSDKNRPVLLYDVENDAWSKKSCEPTKHIQYFSCANLPQ